MQHPFKQFLLITVTMITLTREFKMFTSQGFFQGLELFIALAVSCSPEGDCLE